MDECPSDPGTGQVYHCHKLDCPAHGERNREEARRQLGVCYRCGATKVSDLFKGVYCPRCNDWC
jgi:hypothetical protein